MKLRTCVLASALLIVPLVAMFSHLVPADMRRMAKVGLWKPVEEAALSLVGGETEPAAVETLASQQDRSAPRTLEPMPPWPASSPSADAAEAPPPAAVTAPVERVSFDAASPPSGDGAARAGDPPPTARRPASPEAVADALAASTRGGWTSHVRTVPAPATVVATSPAPLGDPISAPPPASPAIPAAAPTERAHVERQLAELGAIGFEFIPADAGCPRHRCSCRLPADPSGQLQRVFQAADEDPRAALGQLLAEVRSWQRRALAAAPTGAGGGSGGDGVRR